MMGASTFDNAASTFGRTLDDAEAEAASRADDDCDGSDAVALRPPHPNRDATVYQDRPATGINPLPGS